MSLLDLFASASEERKSHIKNLITVAMADGHLAEEEWALLLRIAQRLNMSTEEIQNIKNNPGETKFVVPKKYQDKLQQVNDLVALMMVDGDIDKKELELCKKLALKLDLLPRVVNDLVNKAYYRISNN